MWEEVSREEKGSLRFGAAQSPTEGLIHLPAMGRYRCKLCICRAISPRHCSTSELSEVAFGHGAENDCIGIIFFKISNAYMMKKLIRLKSTGFYILRSPVCLNLQVFLPRGRKNVGFLHVLHSVCLVSICTAK